MKWYKEDLKLTETHRTRLRSITIEKTIDKDLQKRARERVHGGRHVIKSSDDLHLVLGDK